MRKRRKLRPKAIRERQRKRTAEWRKRYYAKGLTYVKKGGHWGWAKRKGRKPSRIHPEE